MYRREVSQRGGRCAPNHGDENAQAYLKYGGWTSLSEAESVGRRMRDNFCLSKWVMNIQSFESQQLGSCG